MEKHSKNFYEFYAAQNLGNYFGMDSSALKIVDKPDIQDIQNDVGIEVTRDVYFEDEQLFDFILKIGDEPVNEVSKEKLKKFQNLGGNYDIENNKFISFSLSSHVNDPQHLLKTILGKLERLNSNDFTKFEHNYLYVFTETTSLFDSYISSIINDVVASKYKIKFERLYLDGYFEICVCDLISCSYERFFMTGEMRNNTIKKVNSMMI